MVLYFGPKNDTSAALDLLRAIAAQMVCVGHAMTFFIFGTNWPFPRPQNIGVLIFFVMSGFLITAVLMRNAANPEYGFGRYFIDRFSRIYSGLFPALLFIAIMDGITLALAVKPSAFGGFSSDYNFGTFVANIYMLQGYSGYFARDALRWGMFGSATPLWTLAIEWHIYMFVGAAFFIVARRGWWLLLIPVALFFGQVPIHFLVGALQDDGVGTGLFSLWLGGSAIYFYLLRFSPPVWVSAAVFVLATAFYVAMLQPGHEYRMPSYPFLIVSVASLLAMSQKLKVIHRTSSIKLAADYSFTLYLIHHTIMFSIVTIHPEAQGWVWLCGSVILSNIVAFALAQLFEVRHRQFARWILQKTGQMSLPAVRMEPR